MENNDYFLNYKNCLSQNQISQMNRITSPFKDNKINQAIIYQNKDNTPIKQNENYYNQFSYFSTPKKVGNIYEPDTLLSPLDSNSKNEIINNNSLLNRKTCLNFINTPFKAITGNSPYNGIKYENKS